MRRAGVPVADRLQLHLRDLGHEHRHDVAERCGQVQERLGRRHDRHVVALPPPDHVGQVEQSPDQPVHPVHHDHVELVVSVPQPRAELRPVERRGGAGGHVQILGHPDDLVAALLTQFAASIQLTLR